MSIEKLIERIKEDAKEKAKKINKEAEKEADALIIAATKEALDNKKALIEDAKKKAQLKKDALLARARLDARDLILKNKRGMLDKVVENVFRKTREMSSSDYENMLLKLLINNSNGTERVMMADSQHSKIVDRANEALAKLGRTAQLKASEEKIKDEGIVLIDEIGTKTDITLKSIIDFYIQELEQEVFNILSGKTSSE